MNELPAAVRMMRREESSINRQRQKCRKTAIAAIRIKQHLREPSRF